MKGGWIWEAKRYLKMEEDEALTCLSVNDEY
jgi:hypothetical protein